MEEGLGAERITEERKLPLLCLKQVDENGFSNAMNMYYVRLFIHCHRFFSNDVPAEVHMGTTKENWCK